MFWISLKPRDIANLFKSEHQIHLSNNSVKRFLKELGYGYRKPSKALATGSYINRNEQFKIIFNMVLIMNTNSPVISIDCKKKERLGNLYRAGKCFCTEALQVYDHDYEHLSQGKVIPHGIYDLQQNKGYVSIGSSSETADFVKDNLLWWWTEYGVHNYPEAKNILLFCDSGGANSYRHHIFKHRMLEFARETSINIVICHYPPYCSKWNPIEHRLFAQMHKAMEGIIFTSYEIVQNAIEQTVTKTGLSVVVRLNLKDYQIGIKVDKKNIDTNRIKHHPIIPELNYRIYA